MLLLLLYASLWHESAGHNSQAALFRKTELEGGERQFLTAPAVAVAFPGSDIRAFIGPFIGYRNAVEGSNWAYSVKNYDLNVTK